MKPRLLVTGGAGFLGTHLLHRAGQFTATGTLHRTAATGIPDVTFHVCDLQQPHEVRILLDRVQPETIVHTACSDQGGNLSAIAPAAGLLALPSAERNIRFIHLSTDQIFDGRAKGQAEDFVRSLNPKATIVRTSLLYDLHKPDRQTKRLIQATQTDEHYRLFIDEWRSPIWVENLVEALFELTEKDYAGILHLAGPQVLNRWELGMELLEHFGITPTCNIQQGTIKESGLVRPSNLTLDSSTAQQLLDTPFFSLLEARKKVRN
jgi:dTDP-4-dehydrorhamnose reductase